MSRSEDNYKLTLGIKKLYPRIVSTKDGPSCFLKNGREMQNAEESKRILQKMKVAEDKIRKNAERLKKAESVIYHVGEIDVIN